jgi:hypothetical protein
VAKAKSGRNDPPPRFKVGDLVTYIFGDGQVTGRIVEDRGCLGVGGRRLYGIVRETSFGEQRYTELGEDELTRA